VRPAQRDPPYPTQAQPPRAREGRPTTGKPAQHTAHAGKPQACWQFCKRDPRLNLFYASVASTIPTVRLYARRSSSFLFLSTGKSPTYPCPPAQHRAALAGHAGHLGSLPVRLAGRPTSAAKMPTLGRGSGASELTGLVATMSGHA
jgi:hypothetical protein